MALEAGPAFEKLIEYLRDTRGFDFTGYKRASLLRRVSLRCSELSIDNFRAYLDYLQVHTEEFGSLFNKILINVTEFFRDKETWDYLAEKVIPRIAAKTGEIRVWSTGTSSGEEAYSAAILLCEALGEESFVERVKIYATDVDEEALAKARGGYTAKELASVDDGLRLRYFERQGERFMFRTALRRTIIFGRHDLTQDAPISRLDLLICRNTLIYFMAETQGRILARFHYALNDDGYLFLGRAEMLLTHAALFTPVDVKERIFTKVASLHLQDRLVLLAQSGSKEATNHIARQLRVRELTTEGTPYPQIVVDAAGILISANQPARLLFTIPADDLGRSLKDLELSYKPVDLRTPIDRINRERRPVSMPSVEIKRGDGTPGLYDIHAAPLIDDDGSLVGIVINYVDITHASQLRSELERLGQELQSTNEELETLNEELESTNAELNSINTDLQLRTREVERLNTLLLAVTGNIEVGAAVLDGGMRVQLWNERAADLWGVRSEEVVGNSFFNLDIGLPAEQLRGLIRAGTGGRPLHDELVVKATTRKGREIRCRVIAHAIGDGDRSAGVVLVMEELKP